MGAFGHRFCEHNEASFYYKQRLCSLLCGHRWYRYLGNMYLTGLGGSLFGFDISSMSAWIGTPQYTDYFNSPDSELQVRNSFLKYLIRIGRYYGVHVSWIFRWRTRRWVP